MNHKKRQRALQRLMDRPVLISDPYDILYYTGYQSAESEQNYLLITPSGPTLFVSPLVGKIKVPNTQIAFFPRLKSALARIRRLGVDQNHLSTRTYLQIKKGRTVVDAPEIKIPREVKDDGELEAMKKAIRVSNKAFASLTVPGKTEREAADGMEEVFHSMGAARAFETIVSSGPNAGRFIHHTPGTRRVAPGDTYIVDWGARWQGYCADITRTRCTNTRIFETVRQIQQECIDRVEPGIPFADINAWHEKALKKAGFPAQHGIGHGIGLQVHELAKELRKGMVITIEPGIYTKSAGCRIEDMVLVKKKPVVLTKSIPLQA